MTSSQAKRRKKGNEWNNIAVFGKKTPESTVKNSKRWGSCTNHQPLQKPISEKMTLGDHILEVGRSQKPGSIFLPSHAQSPRDPCNLEHVCEASLPQSQTQFEQAKQGGTQDISLALFKTEGNGGNMGHKELSVGIPALKTSPVKSLCWSLQHRLLPAV